MSEVRLITVIISTYKYKVAMIDSDPNTAPFTLYFTSNPAKYPVHLPSTWTNYNFYTDETHPSVAVDNYTTIKLVCVIIGVEFTHFL